jgi:hypothetical protein
VHGIFISLKVQTNDWEGKELKIWKQRELCEKIITPLAVKRRNSIRTGARDSYIAISPTKLKINISSDRVSTGALLDFIPVPEI